MKVSFLAIFGRQRSSHILPVKRKSEETQTLIVRGSTEDVSKDSSLITGSLHSSQTLQYQVLASQSKGIATLACNDHIPE